MENGSKKTLIIQYLPALSLRVRLTNELSKSRRALLELRASPRYFRTAEIRALTVAYMESENATQSVSLPKIALITLVAPMLTPWYHKT